MENKPVISERDRERMRQVGECIAEANAEELREHLALSGRERLARSEEFSGRTRPYANIGDREDDEPWKLLDRARELGLLKP